MEMAKLVFLAPNCEDEKICRLKLEVAERLAGHWTPNGVIFGVDRSSYYPLWKYYRHGADKVRENGEILGKADALCSYVHERVRERINLFCLHARRVGVPREVRSIISRSIYNGRWMDVASFRLSLWRVVGGSSVNNSRGCVLQ